MSVPTDPTVELAALRQENQRLQEQLRKFATNEKAARGALSTASAEREATEKLAHQVVVQERVTHEAIASQGGSLGLSVILQIVNSLLLIVMLVGVFAWLPKELSRITTPASSTIMMPGGSVSTTPMR